MSKKEFHFVHYSPTKIEKVKIPKTIGKQFKPKHSIWFGCNEKDWIEFIDDNKYKYKYIADVDLSNIVILKTKEDIIKFHKKFGYYIDDKKNKMRLRLIDWDKMRKETGSYGVFVVDPHIEKIGATYHWYLVFDICSVAIWDPKAIITMKEEKI